METSGGHKKCPLFSQANYYIKTRRSILHLKMIRKYGLQSIQGKYLLNSLVPKQVIFKLNH